MNITIKMQPRLLIAEFADINGLEMVVHERSPRAAAFVREHFGTGKFYAQFANSEVKRDHGLLASTFGNGNTPDEAIEDYANKLSDETLVVGAFTDNRREIHVPILTHKEG